MKEKQRLKRISVASLADLEERLIIGVESLGRGKGVEGEQAFKCSRQRAKKRKKRG